MAKNDDEKIRKMLYEIVYQWKNGHQAWCSDSKVIDNILDWIERQGEHAKFRDSIQVGDKVTRNKDGMFVNLSQLQRVAKPADNEPSFKIEKDKWYVCVRDLDDGFHNRAFYKGDKYLSTEDGTLMPCNSNVPRKILCVDHYFRPWTIQDAKPGDVLYEPNTKTLLIYKSGYYGCAKCFCDYWEQRDILSVCANGDYGVINSVDLIPATRQQEDVMFGILREEGYKWNQNELELEKI